MSAIDTAFDKYIYLKLCWNRALTHANFFISLVQNGSILLILLKVYEIDNIKTAVIVGILAVLCGIYIGHLDVKKGILAKEVSLANKYNPEIQHLVNRESKDTFARRL